MALVETSKWEGAIKYKTCVGWAKHRVPIIRAMGTGFAHPTFNDNHPLTERQTKKITPNKF
jgi:hypothetical protein